MCRPHYIKGKLIERDRFGPVHYRLRVAVPVDIDHINPGQFALVGLNVGIDILLSRPFSIFEWQHNDGMTTLGFLIKVVGKATAHLADLPLGSTLRILAPLGNGFIDPPAGKGVIIVAGGMGIAALFPLVSRLKHLCNPTRVLYGAKSCTDLVCRSELIDLVGNNLRFATEDGGEGKRGLVTDLLREEIEKGEDILLYACGPESMLVEVASIAVQYQRECWVSLERRMVCGVGACLSCVAETKMGYRRTCTDGPVFNAQDLLWRGDA